MTFRNTIPAATALALASILASCSSTGGAEGKRELSKTERARQYVEVANGALLEGDPTGAIQHLKKAADFDEDLPELHHTRALALNAKGDISEAILAAKRALELRPEYPDANNTLGKLYLDQGKIPDAIAPLEKAAKDPTYRESYKPETNLGIAHYRAGSIDEALKHLEKAITADSTRACVARYYRGHIFLKKNRFQDAANSYSQATEKFCGGFADAHLALGIAYEKSRQYDRARKKFLEVQRNFPHTRFAEQALDRLRYIP